MASYQPVAITDVIRPTDELKVLYVVPPTSSGIKLNVKLTTLDKSTSNYINLGIGEFSNINDNIPMSKSAYTIIRDMLINTQEDTPSLSMFTLGKGQCLIAYPSGKNKSNIILTGTGVQIEDESISNLGVLKRTSVQDNQGIIYSVYTNTTKQTVKVSLNLLSKRNDQVYNMYVTDEKTIKLTTKMKEGYLGTFTGNQGDTIIVEDIHIRPNERLYIRTSNSKSTDIALTNFYTCFITGVEYK